MNESIPNIFVVTVMEDRGKNRRSVGWLPTIEAALEAVRTDDGRIPSYRYTYAVIEKTEPGLYSINNKRWWFEWRDGAWHPLGAPGNPTTPHWAIGIVNWGLG